MSRKKKAEEKPQPVVAIDKSETLAHSDSPSVEPVLAAVESVAAENLARTKMVAGWIGDAVLPAACPTCGTSREMMAPHEPCAVCGQQLEDRP